MPRLITLARVTGLVGFAWLTLPDDHGQSVNRGR
jgi:hypothetical protein